MAARESSVIECRSYTFARRYPLVVGKIGGAALWWPMSLTQLGVLVVSVVVLFRTRGWWAHLGALGNLALGVGLPAVLTWMVRHLRIEGRSPLRTLVGAAGYLFAPRRGLRHGKPALPTRATLLIGARLYSHEAG